MIVPTPLDTVTARKARGAFFTPPSLARYVVQWAIRTPGDDVLEPSCGEAAFLLAAAERLGALAEYGQQSPLPGTASEQIADGVGDGAGPHLDGVELHPASARAAESLLRGAGHRARVAVGDFFDQLPGGGYDAVVGNPPYVRYQDFSGDVRRRAREAALRAGVPISDLASSWAAFTVHAAMFCRPGGRLGLVLPAELLSVNYAAGVRRFLMERFARVRLVLFTERVFPDVLEEIVLLLADGYGEGPAQHCELVQARNADELAPGTAVALPVRRWTPQTVDGKWTTSLMSSEGLTAYTTTETGGGFTGLQTWGETTLGMVTGNNKYFALSAAKARKLGLPARELLALSPPGSRHLRGLAFTRAAYADLTSQNAATHLFRPPGDPSPAAAAYIAAGETAGVHEAYKCRVRRPWWRVPLLAPADLLLTYMNADTPRLCANTKRAHHLNSVHGLYLHPTHRDLGVELLALGALTSMTLLGAETVGRAYGGGMLKLEPKEADRLPVPTPELLDAARNQLTAIRPQVARRLRTPKGLLDAVKLVDDVLLVGQLGRGRRDVAALRDAHAELTARRVTRGKSAP